MAKKRRHKKTQDLEKFRSRPLHELANESAGIIEQIGNVILHKWYLEDWLNDEVVKAWKAVSTADDLATLKKTHGRCFVWAYHNHPELRKEFQNRFTSFIEECTRIAIKVKVKVNKSNRYLSPTQIQGMEPISILDEDHEDLAEIDVDYLSETLRAWAQEMEAEKKRMVHVPSTLGGTMARRLTARCSVLPGNLSIIFGSKRTIRQHFLL